MWAFGLLSTMYMWCGLWSLWKFALGGKYGRLVVVVGEKFLVMVEEVILGGCNFGWGHSLNFGKS